MGKSWVECILTMRATDKRVARPVHSKTRDLKTESLVFGALTNDFNGLLSDAGNSLSVSKSVHGHDEGASVVGASR
jgi:hypothetical protein